MIDESNELPKGLLSFAYNAIFNPITNEGARLDLMKEMSKFELSDEAQTLILAAQTVDVPDEESENRLVELLIQELMAGFEGLR